MGRRHFLWAWLAASLTIFASLASASETTSFTYDALGRLIGANVTAGPTAGETTTIAYDPAGNRSTYAVAGGGGGGTPSFAIGDATVTEGGTATFTVTKSGTASGTLTVNYATANGTALSGSDYNAIASTTLTFLASDTSKTLNVTTINDTVVESPEAFTVTLSGNSAGSTISDAQGTGTINDNDSPAAPTFSIADVTTPVAEGGSIVFTVTKSGSGAANVNYASANGTATAGSDYTATSGMLSFTAAQTSKTITVPTTTDSAAEGNETVLMNLSAPTGGATITDAQGTGTISNVTPAPSFRISNTLQPVTEGGNLIYTVTKDGTGAASINYTTANGTATGSDYTTTSGTLTFTATQLPQTITVPTINDSIVEGNETVLVNLSGATGGATISDAQGSGTIADDDTLVIVRTSAGVLASGYTQTTEPFWNPAIGGISQRTVVKFNSTTTVCTATSIVAYCPNWVAGYTVTGNGHEVTKP